MLHAFPHKQSHTPTHSTYYTLALMDEPTRQFLCICECAAEVDVHYEEWPTHQWENREERVSTY